MFTKHCNNILAKTVHGFTTCGIAHAHIDINEITWYSICKLPNGHGTFLVRGEANLTGTIILSLEVVILIPHAIENHQEQFSRHPIATTECVRFKDQIDWAEVVLVKALVASFSITVYIGRRFFDELPLHCGIM
jgi:hypothetical protein